MQAHRPSSRFGLERVLLRIVGVAAAAAAALLLAVPAWDGAAAAFVPHRPGFSHIPGMTRILSFSGDGPCNGLLFGGPSRAPSCYTLDVRGYAEEWILRTAPRGQRLARNVHEDFARAHRGPVLVQASWWRLASARQAKRLLREPPFTLAGHSVQPINRGIGRSNHWWYFQGTKNRHGGGRQIELLWTSGSTVVAVKVIGAELTTPEAQRIALLARPR